MGQRAPTLGVLPGLVWSKISSLAGDVACASGSATTVASADTPSVYPDAGPYIMNAHGLLVIVLGAGAPTALSVIITDGGSIVGTTPVPASLLVANAVLTLQSLSQSPVGPGSTDFYSVGQGQSITWQLRVNPTTNGVTVKLGSYMGFFSSPASLDRAQLL